jgi:predicted Zn-dependent peptidase
MLWTVSLIHDASVKPADILSATDKVIDDPARINSLDTQLRKVTSALVQRTARQYLRQTNRTVLILEAGAGKQAAKTPGSQQ